MEYLVICDLTFKEVTSMLYCHGTMEGLMLMEGLALTKGLNCLRKALCKNARPHIKLGEKYK